MRGYYAPVKAPKGGTDLPAETAAWISNSEPANERNLTNVDSVAEFLVILQCSIDEIREMKSEIGRVYFLFQRLLKQTDRRQAPYDPQYPGERRTYIKSELEHQARAGDNDEHR